MVVWWTKFRKTIFFKLWHRFAASGSTPSLFNFLGPGRQQQSNMQTADIKDAVKLHTRNKTELAQFNKNNEYEIIINKDS